MRRNQALLHSVSKVRHNLRWLPTGQTLAIGALDRTLDTLPCRRFLTTTGLVSLVEGASHHQFALREYGKAIRGMSEALASAEGGKDIRTALIVCLLTICFESFNNDIPTAMRHIRSGLTLIREWKDGLAAQPKLFMTSVEASMYLESIINCMLHWNAAAYAWGSQEEDEAKKRSEPGQHSAAHTARVELRRQTFAKQRQAYLDGFQYWYRSFEPFLNASREKNHFDHTACTALDIRYIAVFTSLNADHFKGEICYDQCTDAFRKIVEMSEELIHFNEANEERGRAKFTFDGPILSSVYIVMLKCQDSVLRRRALKLLSSRPRREAIFDNTLTSKIAALQMQIEEAGREGNFIPEHARIRGIKTTYSIVEKTGRKKYLSMIPGSGGKFANHHIDFS